ncbi:YgdI/YgdR family lipoprotein [uncultured Pseudodesulfovibrio sp.]|uniref:YgdI/YgdR family lipoprotein n=1 Tax=uncultured Pseudodesulfovibrio sp. TaxID=2035858 RepID=UPI0029C64825|nr:YgdI/YgdR family lipoprotein [uncultured Pseudodesulfovibrio sp.]
MLRRITLALSFCLILALAACGTKTYQVTTKSGQTYTANGSLDYDVKSETYKFKNEKGKEIILNQKDIQVIQESE